MWSPDGQQLAFLSERDGNVDIYLMSANGTNQRNLTNHPAYDGSPAWSPDGSRLAFVSSRDGACTIEISISSIPMHQDSSD
ncbi:MAG: hypothetical protein HC884_13355 [Chloroflexaceae bacterium]|nr:hypothetical protein [Chloroflexaceae bacterium]